MVYNKDKHKTDYCIVGLERNADMKAVDKLTKSIHDEFKDILQDLTVLKEPFHYRSKKGQAIPSTSDI